VSRQAGVSLPVAASSVFYLALRENHLMLSLGHAGSPGRLGLDEGRSRETAAPAGSTGVAASTRATAGASGIRR
jgi:hypothetical protein